METAYESLIKNALPSAIIKKTVFNGEYHGWEIAIAPGHLIFFKVKKNDESHITIETYISDTLAIRLIYKKIFDGYIPPSDRWLSVSSLDYNFIKKILENINVF